MLDNNSEEVELDVDEWLAAPGAGSILTGNEEPAKPSIFSKEKIDFKFLDEDPEAVKASEEDKSKAPESFNETIEDLDKDKTEEEEDPEKKTSGRPKVDKSGLVSFLKKRIESKEMTPFDDYDETKTTLEEYLESLSEKDVDDLWTANIDNLKQEIATETPKEFYESLPQELQYAAKYVLDGGQDLKGLFRALSQVEEARTLDPEKDEDQESIIRNYLSATNFGDSSEIEEEITSWKDLGILGKKAKQFKPKLDNMHEQIVAQKLEEQETMKQQQQEAADTYINNTFEALRTGELNGIKLDKKTQSQLYAGLVKPQFSSISGRPTNQLGHLLEKYQFVEPNYPLIAEALWLLSNPDEYRSELVKQGKTKATEEIARKLKTESSRKPAATTFEEEEARSAGKKLQRPGNFFKR